MAGLKSAGGNKLIARSVLLTFMPCMGAQKHVSKYVHNINDK